MWHKCRENYNRMNCGTAQEDKYVGLGQVSLGSAPWTVMMIAGRACGGTYSWKLLYVFNVDCYFYTTGLERSPHSFSRVGTSSCTNHMHFAASMYSLFFSFSRSVFSLLFVYLYQPYFQQ